MSNNNKAPWPVRKGIFRSTGQSDFVPQRTPSPIVELPNTPMSPPISNPMSPQSVPIVESPFSPPIMITSDPPPPSSSPTQAPLKTKLKSRRLLTPINVTIREIPIEVQQEVAFSPETENCIILIHHARNNTVSVMNCAMQVLLLLWSE